MIVYRGLVTKFTQVLRIGLLWATFCAAAEPADSRVPFPVIPLGSGEHCVAETQFMRRNHMRLLMHQRDETVHQGIRGKQHSLKRCLSCHQVEGADSQPVSFASEQHFCRACHDYAAVSIDCFQCHASRPQAELAAGGSVPGVVLE